MTLASLLINQNLETFLPICLSRQSLSQSVRTSSPRRVVGRNWSEKRTTRNKKAIIATIAGVAYCTRFLFAK